MKKLRLIFTIVSLACLSLTEPKVEFNGNSGFAVVELFTSQGCYSCPPVDNVLSQLSRDYVNDVYFLAYHVDYWNKLGWKDPFSDPEFSQYQRNYSKKLGEGVYTPMMIVNGQKAFVGSKKSVAESLIEDALNSSAIKLNLEKSKEELIVRYNLPQLYAKSIVKIAIVKDEETTQIKTGENGGKFLRYTNIVQKVISQNCNAEGINKFTIDSTLIRKNRHIVALIQMNSTLEIIAAGKVQV